MIKFIKSFLVLGAVLFSQSSYALIDAQVLLGRRQMNLDMERKVKDIPGSELHLAVHLDPIPLVPVAFGLSYGMINASKSKTFTIATATDFEVKEITGHELSLEIMVWSPIDLFNITPYLKAGYVPYGVYTFSGSLEAAGTSTI